MRKGTLGLSLLLIFTLIPAYSATPPKAGLSCAKQGVTKTYQGKKFTCIKSGKRLAWNKSEKIQTKNVNENGTSIPNPSKGPFSTWPSDFQLLDLVNEALNGTDMYFGKVTPQRNYDLVLDSKVSEEDLQWITSTLDYVSGSFSNLSRDRLRVYLGTNHDWSRETFRSEKTWIGDPSTPYPCSQGIYEAYCADNNKILLLYSDIYKLNSNAKWDSGRRSTPAHEVFHVAQYWLYGPMSYVGASDPRYLPVWLKEGTAQFYGLYVVERLGLGSYLSVRDQQVRYAQEYKVSVPLSEYQSYGQSKNGVPLNPYGIGQAATEYLIAAVGFSNVLDIFRLTKEKGSFKEGFKEAVGISISDFYKKFENARKSMQIGS